MKTLKILRPALSLAICLIAIIVSLASAHKFETDRANTIYTSGKTIKVEDYSYTVTDYSYYGGDAYTGIQQAGADASNNVVVLGLTVVDAANAIQDAQKNTANNLSALAAPLNASAGNTAAIGSLLSTALAFAFALPGVKSLFDLIQAVLETKKESAVKASVAEATAEEEALSEEIQTEDSAEAAGEPAEPVQK